MKGKAFICCLVMYSYRIENGFIVLYQGIKKVCKFFLNIRNLKLVDEACKTGVFKISA